MISPSDKLVVLLESPRLAADVLTVLDAWRCACDDADDAWLRWCAAAPEDRRDAFSAYRAAEEREAKAAWVYHTCLHRAAALGTGPSLDQADQR